MNRRQDISAAYSILGLVVVVAIAVGLDTLATSLINPTTFPPLAAMLLIFIGTHVLASLLWAAALLLLFWFVLTRAPRNPWIAVLFLLVGLYIASGQVLFPIPLLTGWWPWFFKEAIDSRTSYTALSGSFIAIMGLFMLIVRRR